MNYLLAILPSPPKISVINELIDGIIIQNITSNVMTVFNSICIVYSCSKKKNEF
jgi:hypothetical protein